MFVINFDFYLFLKTITKNAMKAELSMTKSGLCLIYRFFQKNTSLSLAQIKRNNLVSLKRY